jgi:hypothetical protein
MLVSPALRLNQDTGNAVLVIEIPPGIQFIERMHAATIPGSVRMGCIIIPVFGKIYQRYQRQVVLLSHSNSTFEKYRCRGEEERLAVMTLCTAGPCGARGLRRSTTGAERRKHKRPGSIVECA